MEAQIESEAVASRASREEGRVKGQAFELKGTMASLTALRLRTADTGAIAKQLVAKVAQMPQFFQDAAVLVDLGGLGAEAGRVHFGELAALLRSCKMVPVAVANAEGEVRKRAAAAGFGCMPLAARPRSRRPEPAAAEPATSELAEEPAIPEPRDAQPRSAVPDAQPRRGGDSGRSSAPVRKAAPAAKESASVPVPGRPAQRPPVVVHQAVRSGQRIYAEAADLLVLAPVNSGAEVVADGHIHIYSTLRGRAVAGAQGMAEARIFCQRLDAELVAIAGAYLLADDPPAKSKGKPVQIYLEEGACKVGAL